MSRVVVNMPFSKLSLDDIPRPWLPVIIVNPMTGKEVKILGLIDFMPNLSVPLLGVRNFLSHFKLTVDYPNQKFSLREAK